MDGAAEAGGRRRTKVRSSTKHRLISCFRPSSDLRDDSGLDGEDKPRRIPTHLVVTINGIVGSADNWRFAAKQFVKRYPEDVVVHCSECNCATLTFDGVDVMGERLAKEVRLVVKGRPALQKISFVGHSLGGLVARYAIARLYERSVIQDCSDENGSCKVKKSDESSEHKLKGRIAGLEPVNFITFSTPHLGSRFHKQIPMLRGSHALEKMVFHISGIAGRSGKHLFLKDHDEGKPPLLLRMTTDSGDLKFMSALRSFHRRVAYSNARYDSNEVRFDVGSIDRGTSKQRINETVRTCKSCRAQLVGYSRFVLAGFAHQRPPMKTFKISYPPIPTLHIFECSPPQTDGLETSSIRRKHELPKPSNFTKDAKYPHVVYVDNPKNTNVEQEDFREAVIYDPKSAAEMEELMIKGLNRVPWERVDVSFRKSKQRVFAHSTIQVKTKLLNSDGADVIFHMIDNFLL